MVSGWGEKGGRRRRKWLGRAEIKTKRKRRKRERKGSGLRRLAEKKKRKGGKGREGEEMGLGPKIEIKNRKEIS